MFDSVYSIALDILGKIGGDTTKQYDSAYEIALEILDVLGGDTTKKFDSVYSILLDIYQARFGSALTDMDSNYSILKEINKAFDPTDTTNFDSPYSVLVSIDGQPGLIGHVFSIITDAANTVIINGVEQTSVNVPAGETVTWSVSREHYVTQSGSYVMGDEDHSISVTLAPEQFTFVIVPTPADATVTINGSERTSITADYGTNISWVVSAPHYVTEGGTYVLTGDRTENVTLSLETHNFLIVATPANAVIMINGERQNSIVAEYGSSITWSVSADHYVTQTGSYVMGDSDYTERVDLVAVQYTFTINPTPADATVIIDGQIRSSISAPFGTNIPWSVARTGYASQSGVYTVIDDHTENVTLVANQYTFTIVPTPADAYVEINGEPRTSITTAYGTSISWEVSKTGYVTQSNTETLTGDTTRNVTLVENQYTFTIVPTPADATVMINGVQQSSVTVSDGTTLTWEVSKTGYVTQTGSYTIDGADHTENVTLVEDAFMIKGTATAAPTIYYNGTSTSARGTQMTVSYDSNTGEFIASCPAGVRPTSMAYASYQQTSIMSINYVGDLSNCTSILGMFTGCTNMTDFNANISISSTCTSPGPIFSSCSALKTINILNRFNYYGFRNSNIIGDVNSLESVYCRGISFNSSTDYSGNMFTAASKFVKYIEVQDPRQVGRCSDTADGVTLKLWNVVNKTKISNSGVQSVSNSYLPVSGPYKQTGTTTYNQAVATEGVFNIDMTALSSTYVNYLKNILVRYISVQSYYGVTVYGYRYTRIWISRNQYWENDFDLDKGSFMSLSQYHTGHFPLNSWTLVTVSAPSNPLKFTTVTSGDITWNAKTDVDASKKTINYSKNGGLWTPITAAYGTPAAISVNAGDVVEFYGINSNYGDGTDGAYFGSANGATFSASGDISSLIDSTAIVGGMLPDNAFRGLFDGCTGLVSGAGKMTFGSSVTGMGDSSCRYMFNGCTGLTTIPLDSLDYTLGGSCFRDMFKNCTNLAETPVLPQTTLADSCYYGMFNGCSSITTAPVLPATTLETSCYREMLRGTAITTAPALPATTLASYCYQSMFNSCYDMTTGPASLPATTLANYCYAYMFENCQYMTTTPTMPTVTNIPTYAYRAMFKNCYRITSAPVLNVQSTGTYGCYGMFQGCTSLTSVTGTLNAIANYAYQYMFDGCTNITTVPEITYTGTVSGVAATGTFVRMFQNCSSLQRIKCLTATGGGNPFNNWVSGVAATGTFVKNGVVAWNTGVNYCPSGWTQDFEHYNFTGTATSSPTLYVNRTSDSSGGSVMGAIEYDTDTKQFRTRIPTTVTSLRGMAYNNSALTSIDMSNGYPFEYIDQSMFYNCTNITSITLPDDITRVKTGAFGNCTALTSIEFPDSVNEIVYDSLFGCTALTSITVNSINPPKLAAAFPYVTATIYVPAESVNAYKTATGDYVGWSIMASQIQPIQ